MMYWTADKRLFKKDFDRVGAAVRLFLVLLGLLIGLSLGFWFAVRTLPLPSVTHEYHYRNM